MWRQAALHPHERRRRPGAGRPRGSFGSRILRGVLQRQQKQAAHRPVALDPLQVVSAAAARAAHAREHLAKRRQLVDTSAAASSRGAFGAIRVLNTPALGAEDLAIIRACRQPPRRTCGPVLLQLKQRLARVAHRALDLPARWVPTCVEALLLKSNRRRLRDDHLAFSSLVFCSARLIWSSLLKRLRGQIACGVYKGELCILYS